MQVLVTGGMGFIGSHLVDRFLDEGFKVRVLDSLDPKVHTSEHMTRRRSGVDFIHGDVTDRHALLAALQGIDVVSHQAGYQDYMHDYSKFFQTNVVGTALLYEVIRERRLMVQKVVLASSQAVYGEGQYECRTHGLVLPFARSRTQMLAGDWEPCCPVCGIPIKPLLLTEEYPNPFNQYALSKYSQELAALRLGRLLSIPTVALRYSITQGPRQSLFNQYSGICRIFFTRALNNRPLTIYEDGQQTRDFVHVQDVVDANMLVLEKDAANFQAFNVGSGKATTVVKYANLVLNKTGSKSELQIPGEYRGGDNRHSVSCINKLKGLGWNPQRDLSTILDDFHAWVESIGGIPEGLPDAHEVMKRAGVVLRIP